MRRTILACAIITMTGLMAWGNPFNDSVNGNCVSDTEASDIVGGVNPCADALRFVDNACNDSVWEGILKGGYGTCPGKPTWVSAGACWERITVSPCTTACGTGCGSCMTSSVTNCL